MFGGEIAMTWMAIAGIMLVKLVPIMLVGGVGYYFFKRSEMGRALTRRSDTSGDMVLLQQQVDDLRTELSEMQERLDYSERVLTQLDLPLRHSVTLPKRPTPPEPVHG
jgi:hypothetical protein